MDANIDIFSFVGFAMGGVPMMILLIVVGLYIGLRIGFIQLKKLPHISAMVLFSIFKPASKSKGALSPLQTLSTALAGTVGTGNIAGVAGAIALGGPGAVFWMWVAAIIGMGTKYAEIVLAVFYRQKNIKGEWVGGPMYYIKNGLADRFHPLATAFSFFGCLAALGIGNMTQANTVATAIAQAIPTAYGTAIKLTSGVAMLVLVAFVLLGNLRRVGSVTEKIVPIMALLYIVACLIIVLANLDKVIPTMNIIFSAAFNPKAALGGGVGITLAHAMQFGFGRGVFSNEAGLGSAPIAHACADTDSPVKQGFFGVVEVFIDTIVICTLTAFAILVTETPVQYGKDIGAGLTLTAFADFYGSLAPFFLAIAISLFACSSMVSWSLYGIRCFEMLLGSRYTRYYKLLFLAAILPSTILDVGLIWDISALLNAVMTLPNIIALVLLTNRVAMLTKGYFNKAQCSPPQGCK